MANYTSTDFGKSINLVDIMLGLNELTNGWFSGLLLLFLFLVITALVHSRTEDLVKSITTSSFIITIIGLLFWAVELIELYFVIIALVIFILMIFVLFFAPRK